MNAMINNNLSLVSGANGHLGNNLVRFLTGQDSGKGNSPQYPEYKTF
jgi:hypothetical protein